MFAVLVAPLAALAVLAAASLVLAAQRWSQRRLVGSEVGADPAGPGADAPDILHFTGESCTICHLAQRPALDRLRSLLGDLVVREIDVAGDPSSARRYRVMTLPTTVVLDRRGRTVAINAGYASEAVLREQVKTARSASRQAAFA